MSELRRKIYLFLKYFGSTTLVWLAFEQNLLKINAKRFGRKKFTLIFATRFEKRGGSLRQVLQIKAEKIPSFFNKNLVAQK